MCLEDFFPEEIGKEVGNNNKSNCWLMYKLSNVQVNRLVWSFIQKNDRIKLLENFSASLCVPCVWLLAEHAMFQVSLKRREIGLYYSFEGWILKDSTSYTVLLCFPCKVINLYNTVFWALVQQSGLTPILAKRDYRYVDLTALDFRGSFMISVTFCLLFSSQVFTALFEKFTKSHSSSSAACLLLWLWVSCNPSLRASVSSAGKWN